MGSLKSYYYGEYYWDIISFLNSLKLPEISIIKRDKLLNFILNELIILNARNPRYNKMKNYYGLSIFAFDNRYYKDLYNNLKFFNDIQIYKLFDKAAIIE